MNREEQQEILNSLKQMYGIHAIWFFGIGDLVRIQFTRTHLEFIEFEKVHNRVLTYFEEEYLRIEGAIRDLKSLPYVSIYVGTMEKPVQKTYVLLSDVIKQLNFRRKEIIYFKKDIKILKEK